MRIFYYFEIETTQLTIKNTAGEFCKPSFMVMGVITFIQSVPGN